MTAVGEGGRERGRERERERETERKRERERVRERVGGDRQIDHYTLCHTYKNTCSLEHCTYMPSSTTLHYIQSYMYPIHVLYIHVHMCISRSK